MFRKDFNLMVTYEYGLQNYRYVIGILGRFIGDMVVVEVGSSVVLIRTKDPYEAVEKLRGVSDKLGVIYRVIPVDRVLEPYVEIIRDAAAELSDQRIPVDKTFKVVLNGRLYWRDTRLPAHSRDAILAIAEKISRKVSLTNPDYVVYVRSVKFRHMRRLATLTVTEAKNILSLKSGKP
ncbi:MAG: THUMP domain-containing protein [Desulfurococcaceae archaeon]